ncbi:MAG: porin [Rhodomicrobium sp.]
MKIGRAWKVHLRSATAKGALACAFALSTFAPAAQAQYSTSGAASGGTTLGSPSAQSPAQAAPGVTAPPATDSGGGLGGSLKDMTLPSVTAAGITIYGTIDVGVSYVSHGVPASGTAYAPLYWNIFGAQGAGKPIWSVVDNALSQSFVGVKIEESIGYGFTAIGKFETGFNPISGELADACASIVRNNGKQLFPQDQSTWYDGSRCGQAFNGVDYGGVSSPQFGTLTFGHQQSLITDAIATYDPMGLSYAFSMIGWSGSLGGGIGNTESFRWANSVKYIYQYGPAHVAGMYSDGGPDTSMFNGAWGADVGITWQGFSIDALYTKERGVNSASPYTFSTSGAAGTCNPFSPGYVAGVFNGNFCSMNALNGTITDNTAWSVQAKYTYEFEEWGGGLKDKPVAGPKLTIYGGYLSFDQMDPVDPVANGSTIIGGYFLTTVNNHPIDSLSSRDRWTTWAGAKLDIDGHWNITGAWYQTGQDNFINGSERTCAEQTAANVAASKTTLKVTNFPLPGSTTTVPGYFGYTAGSNCAGTINQGSFLVDYIFNKNWDVYTGVTYSEAGGGFLAGSQTGFLNNAIAGFATGMRLRF